MNIELYLAFVVASAVLIIVPGPNVMLIVDNSGSMNNITWHPEFDPTVTPTCQHYNDSTTYSFSSTLTLNRCGNTRRGLALVSLDLIEPAD